MATGAAARAVEPAGYASREERRWRRAQASNTNDPIGRDCGRMSPVVEWNVSARIGAKTIDAEKTHPAFGLHPALKILDEEQTQSPTAWTCFRDGQARELADTSESRRSSVADPSRSAASGSRFGPSVWFAGGRAPARRPPRLNFLSTQHLNSLSPREAYCRRWGLSNSSRALRASAH